MYILDNNESDLFNLHEEIGGTLLLGDIRDKRLIHYFFDKYRFHIVLHCAAYKHVSILQHYPQEAIKNNILGTLNLIWASHKYKVEKFVFISTDKAVKPSCVMGETKKVCEELCYFANTFSKTKFIIVRFGNVLASRGSVVEIFKKQIEKESDLTVTDKKMKRYTMGIYEAAELILDALNRSSGTYILDMGEEIYIDDLARFMIKLSGKDLKIQYIGKKKGEKYFEELYDPKEEKIQRVNKKLFKIIKQ